MRNGEYDFDWTPWVTDSGGIIPPYIGKRPKTNDVDCGPYDYDYLLKMLEMGNKQKTTLVQNSFTTTDKLETWNINLCGLEKTDFEVEVEDDKTVSLNIIKESMWTKLGTYKFSFVKSNARNLNAEYKNGVLTLSSEIEKEKPKERLLIKVK